MTNGLSAIKHVVVLMFENRSFDHVFGALPGVEGVLDSGGKVKPSLFNVPDPTRQPWPDNVPVQPTGIGLQDQATLIPHDFNHDFCDGMMPDLFGPGTTGYTEGKPIHAPAFTYPETNSGFISSLYYPPTKASHSSLPPVPELPYPTGPSAMTYFSLGELPVLHSLAREFVVCDNWFCDMPGHTLPNRVFMHCAQTDNLGIADDDQGHCHAKTIFQLIEEQGKSWKIYAPCLLTDSRFLTQIKDDPRGNIPIQQFAEDIQSSEAMPFYSFLMCWSGNTQVTDSSMHPASFMEPGENYLAAVYNALCTSPVWNETLLIVIFDENGGIYDHVPPPTAVSPKPGEKVHSDYHNIHAEFDFTVLGPRIPVILISPWLSPGVESTQYQNTSILRFLADKATPVPLQLFLTERDKKANSIARAFDQFGLPEPRTKSPVAPIHPGFVFADGLSDFMCPDERPDVTPAPHMAEVAKIYGVK